MRSERALKIRRVKSMNVCFYVCALEARKRIWLGSSSPPSVGLSLSILFFTIDDPMAYCIEIQPPELQSYCLVVLPVICGSHFTTTR